MVTVAPAGPSPKGLDPLDGPGALIGLMLDIGGDTGALVVLVDEPLDGSEIEVVGVRGHAHAQVHRRRSGAGGDVYAGAPWRPAKRDDPARGRVYRDLGPTKSRRIGPSDPRRVKRCWRRSSDSTARWSRLSRSRCCSAPNDCPSSRARWDEPRVRCRGSGGASVTCQAKPKRHASSGARHTVRAPGSARVHQIVDTCVGASWTPMTGVCDGSGALRGGRGGARGT